VGNTTARSAATLDLDLDDDGIANNVDGNSTVTPAQSNALTPSARFSDKVFAGGKTSGVVESPFGSPPVVITDNTAAGKGLDAVAGGTSGIARLSVDGKTGTIKIPAGGRDIATDPPATITLEAIEMPGEIEYVIGGVPVVVVVGEGGIVSATETITKGALTGLTIVEPPESDGSVTVNGTPVGGATLTAKLDLSATRLALNSTLTVADAGAISLPEALTVQVGSYTAVIDGTLFARNKQQYTFAGIRNGVALKVAVSRSSLTQYAVKVEGTGANLAATSNPVTVGVTIGDDSAVGLVKAALN
jgi:hypothetical protein